tara:strand:- start:160 stop:624 length:465 start_codon:yes stop_codon:yes gene_type:complete
VEEKTTQEVSAPEMKSTKKDYEWKSENIDKLGAALAKAQSEMDGAAKKSTNPFFNSGYADLHTVIQACMPQLTKHGISVVQGTEWDVDHMGGHYYVSTTLIHSSGQWMKSRCRLIVGGKKDIQALGGAITYGRRYGLSAMAGIGQFDDDGNTNK